MANPSHKHSYLIIYCLRSNCQRGRRLLPPFTCYTMRLPFSIADTHRTFQNVFSIFHSKTRKYGIHKSLVGEKLPAPRYSISGHKRSDRSYKCSSFPPPITMPSHATTSLSSPWSSISPVSRFRLPAFFSLSYRHTCTCPLVPGKLYQR